MERDMRTPEQPVTLARLERALDRLAIIMTDFPDLGRKVLLLYEKLDREAETLRAQEETMGRVRARAKRVRAAKALR